MENSQLTIADLASLKNLLSAAFARGAFKLEEASAVGAVFDRLDRFLQAQAMVDVPPQPTQPEPIPSQGETNA